MYENISLRLWLPVQRSRLYLKDPRILRAHQCGRPRESVHWLKICHEKKEYRAFAGRSSGKRPVVESYYGSVAYGDFGKKLQVKKRYEKRYMCVTAKSLRR